MKLPESPTPKISFTSLMSAQQHLESIFNSGIIRLARMKCDAQVSIDDFEECCLRNK
jgi:hypothetical protein